MILALSVLPLLPYNWLPCSSIFLSESLGQISAARSHATVFLRQWIADCGDRRMADEETWDWGASSCACALAHRPVLGSGADRLVFVGRMSIYGFELPDTIYGVFISRYFVQDRQKAFLINNMVLAVMGGTGPMTWVSGCLDPSVALRLFRRCANLLFGLFILFFTDTGRLFRLQESEMPLKTRLPPEGRSHLPEVCGLSVSCTCFTGSLNSELFLLRANCTINVWESPNSRWPSLFQ